MDAPTATGVPSTGRSTRRVVLATLGIVAAVALLAAAAALGVLRWRDAAHERDAARAEAATLRSDVSTLSNRLGAARRLADAEYLRGLNAGKKAERDLNKSIGLTYSDGYKEGRASAFSGFTSPWRDGAWYFVQIKKAPVGNTIEYRVDVDHCTLMYETNDEIYTKGSVGAAC